MTGIWWEEFVPIFISLRSFGIIFLLVFTISTSLEEVKDINITKRLLARFILHGGGIFLVTLTILVATIFIPSRYDDYNTYSSMEDKMEREVMKILNKAHDPREPMATFCAGYRGVTSSKKVLRSSSLYAV